MELCRIVSSKGIGCMLLHAGPVPIGWGRDGRTAVEQRRQSSFFRNSSHESPGSAAGVDGKRCTAAPQPLALLASDPRQPGRRAEPARAKVARRAPEEQQSDSAVTITRYSIAASNQRSGKNWYPCSTSCFLYLVGGKGWGKT